MEIWHHLPDKKLKSLKLKCVVNAPDTIQIEPIRFDVMEEIPFGGQRMDICKSTRTHTHTHTVSYTHSLSHTQSLTHTVTSPISTSNKNSRAIFANRLSEEWREERGVGGVADGNLASFSCQQDACKNCANINAIKTPNNHNNSNDRHEKLT